MDIQDNEQLKDIIANMDADVYVLRNHVEDIAEWLLADGYTGFTEEQVAQVLGELRVDPYFKKLAENLA